jgi:bud site selection protein 31
MPLPTKWHKKKGVGKAPPAGFDYVEPTLEALENELRDRVKESNLSKRKAESMWPIHQINWQKTRYIYDLYYTYQKIDRKCYQYILDQKLVDANLIAKWKKPGYERLCSTYVINPTNYKFGNGSICRVPWSDRTEDQKQAKDPTVRCWVCCCRTL